MTASIIIYRHDSNESAAVSRDVRDVHPAWVHEQLGTDSESALQAYLDNVDPFALAGDTIGDSDGIRLADPQLCVIGDMGGPNEDRGIVHEVSGWESGAETWTPISDLTID